MNTSTARCRLLAAVSMMLVMLALPVAPIAQPYPAKPIRLINPFAAGGTGEILFRLLEPTLEARLGQKIVLEGRTGAGGNIGAEAVANAPADGYTLLIGATNMFVVNQFLFPKMTFDPLKVLAPITIIADVPSVFYVHPSLPARNLQDLIAYARANPGKLNYASPGTGTTPHLNVELLSQFAGINMVHVPYKGLQPAMAAVIANEVQLYLAGLGAGLGHLKAGKLRAIAVGSRERMPGIPDVPTVIESGFKDFVASNWFAFAAPAGTDAQILERWAAETRHALAQPEVQRRLGDLGIVAVGNSPAQFAAALRREAQQWQQVIVRGGIKLQ